MPEGPHEAPPPQLLRTEEAWSDVELKATLEAYKRLLNGERLSKAGLYRELSQRFSRASGAYERRMQNISAVLSEQGKPWVPGLKPQKNLGAKVRPRLERLMQEILGGDGGTAPAYEPEVLALLDQPHLPVPTGQQKPATSTKLVTDHARDAAVKAWVLKNAQGMCECCGKPAPFRTVDDLPYLEVHHVRTLASGGADTVDNTVAICPNCHRELHHGTGASELRARLYAKVDRLSLEPSDGLKTSLLLNK